jgi:hypothetical protein
MRNAADTQATNAQRRLRPKHRRPFTLVKVPTFGQFQSFAGRLQDACGDTFELVIVL